MKYYPAYTTIDITYPPHDWIGGDANKDLYASALKMSMEDIKNQVISDRDRLNFAIRGDLTTNTEQIPLLREMDVTIIESERIVIFPNYPYKAALFIESSIPNLIIDSNFQIIADESEPHSGIYRIIIDPFRQVIYFSAAGYLRASFPTGNLRARDVIFLRIEPKDR